MGLTGFSPFGRSANGRTLASPFRLFYPFGKKDSGSPEIEHVADANARLSLDPTTHPTDTFQVIQDDDGLTYTFTGPGADADAGLWVTGAGTTDWNDAYEGPAKHDEYAPLNGPWNVTGPGNWTMAGEYTISSSQTYPWQAFWFDSGINAPAPIVTRNPIASENNWTQESP